MKKLIPLLFIPVLLVACRASRSMHKALVKPPVTDTAIVNVHPDSVKAVDTTAVIREQYAALQKNQISFSSFSAKIDVDYYDAEGRKTNVNAHIRMQKDSVIWISVTGLLGVEGLRAIVRPDSVFILDKLKKVYIPRSVAYLQEMTDLPLNLGSLQDLLIGNPVFLDPEISGFSRDGNSVSLTCMGKFFKNLMTMSDETKLMNSCKLDDVDPERNRTCYLGYDSYENKDSINFSTERDITVSEKKKLEFRLHYKQYSFNETLTFPFSVPKNYKQN